jgi:4-aminobutyrate--pyruvate transaminase
MAFCQQHGLIVRAIGDSVAICPPYIVTAEQVEDIFTLFEHGLNDTLDWVRKEGLI